MATVDRVSSDRSPISILAGVQRVIDRLADSRWRAMRRERALIARELANMQDTDVRDLGISRSDFPAILDGTFRR